MSSFLFWAFFVIFRISQANSNTEWGMVGTKCIRVYKEMLTFDSAKKSCEQTETSLFIIENQAEMDFMTSFQRKANMWIGLEFDSTKKKWVWIDKRELVRHQWWEKGEPSSRSVAYFREGTLRSKSSFYKLFYICQKKTHKVWKQVKSSDYYLCGIEIMPNCEGLPCEEVCQSHYGCNQFAKMLNVCVNIKNDTLANNCVIKMRPNSELYRFHWSCGN